MFVLFIYPIIDKVIQSQLLLELFFLFYQPLLYRTRAFKLRRFGKCDRCGEAELQFGVICKGLGGFLSLMAVKLPR
jgi:hypothetical protein